MRISPTPPTRSCTRTFAATALALLAANAAYAQGVISEEWRADAQATQTTLGTGECAQIRVAILSSMGAAEKQRWGGREGPFLRADGSGLISAADFDFTLYGVNAPAFEWQGGNPQSGVLCARPIAGTQPVRANVSVAYAVDRLGAAAWPQRRGQVITIEFTNAPGRPVVANRVPVPGTAPPVSAGAGVAPAAPDPFARPAAETSASEAVASSVGPRDPFAAAPVRRAPAPMPPTPTPTSQILQPTQATAGNVGSSLPTPSGTSQTQQALGDAPADAGPAAGVRGIAAGEPIRASQAIQHIGTDYKEVTIPDVPAGSYRVVLTYLEGEASGNNTVSLVLRRGGIETTALEVQSWTGPSARTGIVTVGSSDSVVIVTRCPETRVVGFDLVMTPLPYLSDSRPVGSRAPVGPLSRLPADSPVIVGTGGSTPSPASSETPAPPPGPSVSIRDAWFTPTRAVVLMPPSTGNVLRYTLQEQQGLTSSPWSDLVSVDGADLFGNVPADPSAGDASDLALGQSLARLFCGSTSQLGDCSGAQPTPDPPDSVQLVSPGLLPNVTRRIRVIADYVDGTRGVSDVRPVILPRPTNPEFGARAAGPGVVDLGWTFPPGADRVVISGPGLTADSRPLSQGAIFLPGPAWQGSRRDSMGVTRISQVPGGTHTFRLVAMHEPGPTGDSLRPSVVTVAVAAPLPAPPPGNSTTGPRPPSGDASSAPTSTGPAAPAKTTGRYRVSIAGFKVNHETFDDQLERDGKRDEVYVTAWAQVIDRATGAARAPGVIHQSAVHGDTWNLPGRILAGTASDRGGIKTGDRVGATPGLGRAFSSTVPYSFPMEVWVGTLSDATDTLLVMPVLWEKDNDDSASRWWTNFVSQEWAGELGRWLANLKPSITEITDNRVGSEFYSGGPRTAANTYTMTHLGSYWDPIHPLETGARARSFVNLRPGSDRPIGMDAGIFVYRDHVIAISREAIEAGLARRIQPSSEPVWFTVRLRDRDLDGMPTRSPGDPWLAMEGDYELYLAAERLP